MRALYCPDCGQELGEAEDDEQFVPSDLVEMCNNCYQRFRDLED